MMMIQTTKIVNIIKISMTKLFIKMKNKRLNRKSRIRSKLKGTRQGELRLRNLLRKNLLSFNL